MRAIAILHDWSWQTGAGHKLGRRPRDDPGLRPWSPKRRRTIILPIIEFTLQSETKGGSALQTATLDPGGRRLENGRGCGLLLLRPRAARWAAGVGVVIGKMR